MIDYIYKVGNFNVGAQTSAFNLEGYYDPFNMSAEDLTSSTVYLDRRKTKGFKDGDYTEFEFIICPNTGFLGNNLPLPKDCELKLSFDRAPPYSSVLRLDGGTDLNEPFTFTDIVATTEYVSSPHWRDIMSSIDHKPLLHTFDECDVMIKNIPLSETEIRFDNLRGGNTPVCMFFGIIPQSCLTGDPALSSTYFKQHEVKEMNITLNGNSVNGYPMSIRRDNPTLPLQKFLDVTNRYYNVSTGKTLDLDEFKFNWLWSHVFESESTSQGWIGVNFKLAKAYTTNMALVCWTVSRVGLTIDKFGSAERISL